MNLWWEIYGTSTFSFRSFRMLQIDWNININTSWKMYINIKSFKHVKKGSQSRHQELGWLKDIGRQKNRNKIEAGSHGSTTNAGVSGLDWIGFRFDDSIQNKTLMGMAQVSSWDTWCILKAQWDVIDALLGDGFKHLFFLSYFGEIIQFDEHIFQIYKLDYESHLYLLGGLLHNVAGEQFRWQLLCREGVWQVTCVCHGLGNFVA